MQIIYAIRTLRIVCGFLDMGDGRYLIFNKNQLMFIVRKSITAQIKKNNNFVLFVTIKSHLVKTVNGPVLLIWWNSLLVALDMMTKTWNFVTKKIADGVNKFLSFLCVILIWCVCMIFSKISLVTSHGAFSTRFDFTAGNTPCREINQSTTSIHSVPSVLVFRTAQVENTRLKCSGDVSLGKECENKLQTHTQESL